MRAGEKVSSVIKEGAKGDQEMKLYLDAIFSGECPDGSVGPHMDLFSHGEVQPKDHLSSSFTGAVDPQTAAMRDDFPVVPNYSHLFGSARADEGDSEHLRKLAELQEEWNKRTGEAAGRIGVAENDSVMRVFEWVQVSADMTCTGTLPRRPFIITLLLVHKMLVLYVTRFEILDLKLAATARTRSSFWTGGSTARKAHRGYVSITLGS